MGTDIHMYAEVKRNGVWRPIRNLENVEYLPDDSSAQRHEPIQIYKGRDYVLFDILADMRTTIGRTVDDRKFDAIAPPRGLPEDLSPEMRDWAEDGQEAPLGSSYLLLSEILDFDWHGKVMHFEAMVDARVAHLFVEDEPFPSDKWPKDVLMSYSVIKRDGVTVRWTDTYAASVGEGVLELFKGLTQHGDPSHVRLVFWFDH